MVERSSSTASSTSTSTSVSEGTEDDRRPTSHASDGGGTARRYTRKNGRQETQLHPQRYSSSAGDHPRTSPDGGAVPRRHNEYEVTRPTSLQLPERRPKTYQTSDDEHPRVSLTPGKLLRKHSLAFWAFRSSGGSAKSAPTTPYGEWGGGSTATGGGGSGGGSAPPPPSPISSSPTPPKSPSNSAGRQSDKAERQALKQLSASAPPAMTQAPQVPPKPGSTGGDASSTGTPTVLPPMTPTPDEPGSSKSRQKKFHRHFKQVAQEERVLNYYSCALVADILLQGQLYITKNYFAFYSNVFGYVTKLLIPTVSVLKISKEKTARIIPNAVGVVTEEEKHVFGSLLSRDSTYRLMTTVWKAAMGPDPLITLPVLKDLADDVDTRRYINEGYESSLSGSERSIAITPTITVADKILTALCPKKEGVLGNASTVKLEPAQLSSDKQTSLYRPTTLLLVSTVLLVFLFLSAAFLLYRISMIQTQFADNPLLSGSDQVYQEILKWQAQLHSRSANEVQEFLNSNLDQLAKVRKSLEALSLLLLRNEEYARTTRDRQQNYDASFLRNGHS